MLTRTHLEVTLYPFYRIHCGKLLRRRMNTPHQQDATWKTPALRERVPDATYTHPAESIKDSGDL